MATCFSSLHHNGFACSTYHYKAPWVIIWLPDSPTEFTLNWWNKPTNQASYIQKCEDMITHRKSYPLSKPSGHIIRFLLLWPSWRYCGPVLPYDSGQQWQWLIPLRQKAITLTITDLSVGLNDHQEYISKEFYLSIKLSHSRRNTVKCRYNAVLGVQEIDRVIAVTAL